jgi:hypothetical protein
MRTLRTFRLCSWALLLFPLVAAAQPITVTTVPAPVNTLSITDIDFLNSTTPKWLFTINLFAGRTVSATMTVTLDVALATGERFPRAIELVTRAFTIPSSRTITNLDIGKSKPIKDSSYIVDPAAKRRFEEVALPSGTMPAGSYNFLVTVLEVGGPASGSQAFSIVLTNPSAIELLFPFDGDNGVGRFPLFQWLFDGSSSTIAVFEKLPGQTSMEEAASGVPHLKRDVVGTSFQYPSAPGAGERSLEPGKTYAWYVEGRVSAAGGAGIVIKSPLRSFTVAAQGAYSASSLLEEVERLLDAKHKPVFDQIRAEGLSATGVFRLNGAILSRAELTRLLDQLRSNPGVVMSVGIE